MSDQTDNLSYTLEKFGLSQNEVAIYLYLLDKLPSTALSISRNLHLSRTKVYRILDKLIEKRLVIQKLNSSGLSFIAANPSQLDVTLKAKEEELKTLRTKLPNLLQELSVKANLNKYQSQILYYHGKNGLSQVNWNLLKAKGVFYSYEVSTADAYLPKKEAENLREEIVSKKISVKTIMNNQKIEPFTQVSELVTKYWEVKYISPKILNIQTDVFIYNDVYAVCHYLDHGDIFCFELTNKQFAQMQKELFLNLWNQAKKLTILSDNGKAVLEK